MSSKTSALRAQPRVAWSLSAVCYALALFTIASFFEDLSHFWPKSYKTPYIIQYLRDVRSSGELISGKWDKISKSSRLIGSANGQRKVETTRGQSPGQRSFVWNKKLFIVLPCSLRFPTEYKVDRIHTYNFLRQRLICSYQSPMNLWTLLAFHINRHDVIYGVHAEILELSIQA